MEELKILYKARRKEAIRRLYPDAYSDVEQLNDNRKLLLRVEIALITQLLFDIKDIEEEKHKSKEDFDELEDGYEISFQKIHPFRKGITIN